MTDLSDLPRIKPDMIDQPAQSVATIEPATLKQTVIASFSPIRAMCATLAERYRDVAFDYKTPKGMEQAKAARLELREDGRYAVQRLQERLKKEANDLKKTVDAEAATALEPLKPVEDAIHQSIVAREDEIEAEREKARQVEAERLAALAAAEAERKAKHEAGIAKIRGYIGLANGLPAARIQLGIDALAAMAFGDSWEEFQSAATAARDETVTALKAMHAAAVDREAEAARIEAQRLENERIAAEQARIAAKQKAETDRLAAIAAELQRKADELAAQQAEAEAERMRQERSGINPETGEPWRLTDPQIQAELQADLDEMKADPSKAVAFLQDMGVLDAGGNLTEQFGGVAAEAEMSEDEQEAIRQFALDVMPPVLADIQFTAEELAPQEHITSVDVAPYSGAVQMVDTGIDIDQLLEDCKNLIGAMYLVSPLPEDHAQMLEAKRLLDLLLKAVGK